MKTVAINGFGRIGRMFFRAAMYDPEINVVAINDLTDPKTLAHLLKYDSVHGRLNAQISHGEHSITVEGKEIHVYAEKDPKKLPWKKHGIDVVIECTGRFLTTETAKAHIKAGAKKVLLSAPAKDDKIKTIVKGVNEHELKANDIIVSNASCTTNCFAPIVKVLNDNFGIEKGFMVTAHAYTAAQNVVDGPNKDLRRARTAAMNIVPTSSGAAKAVRKVIPEIGDCLHSTAIRVPIPNGSMIYFVANLKRDVSAEEINELMKNVSKHHLADILEYTEDEIVSSDIIGNPHSAIFDSGRTVTDGNMIKVVAWYDNEWGYSCRMVDVAKLL